MAKILILSIMLFTGSSVFGQQEQQEQELEQNELVLLAVDYKLPVATRTAAIEEAALQNQWQTLARILLIVAIEHDNRLRENKDITQLDIARNIDDVISLGIDEFFVLRELERIGNPGAIPYIEQFRSIRSNQGFVHSGEYWASIDNHNSGLKGKMLDWRPLKKRKKQDKQNTKQKGQKTKGQKTKGAENKRAERIKQQLFCKFSGHRFLVV